MFFLGRKDKNTTLTQASSLYARQPDERRCVSWLIIGDVVPDSKPERVLVSYRKESVFVALEAGTPGRSQNHFTVTSPQYCG